MKRWILLLIKLCLVPPVALLLAYVVMDMGGSVVGMEVDAPWFAETLLLGLIVGPILVLIHHFRHSRRGRLQTSGAAMGFSDRSV